MICNSHLLWLVQRQRQESKDTYHWEGIATKVKLRHSESTALYFYCYKNCKNHLVYSYPRYFIAMLAGWFFIHNRLKPSRYKKSVQVTSFWDRRRSFWDLRYLRDRHRWIRRQRPTNNSKWEGAAVAEWSEALLVRENKTKKIPGLLPSLGNLQKNFM